MTNKVSLGKKGEDKAIDYLIGKGYRIIRRNYRYKKSEIDIICRYNKTVVFVEVKARTSLDFGYPEDFVNERQIEKLHEGASKFIEENLWEGSVRFDIIAIIFEGDTTNIEHLQDAF